MPQVISTLARVDWQRMAAYTIRSPKQALINAAIAYFAFRQATKAVRKVSIYGLTKTLSLLWRYMTGAVIRHVRRAPGTGVVVQKNIAKMVKDIEESMVTDIPGESKYLAIPEHGMTDEEILAILNRRQNEVGIDWKSGRASGAVYHGGEKLVELTNKAYGLFNITNPLHPGVFPGLRRIEAEVVRMVLDLYNGGPE
ncbi:Dihydrosphingosine phosphate lyase, partial [Coemansia sp. BCRC 34490]